MKSSILYFLLFVFGIPLNLSLDVSYKRGRFSKTLPNKGLELAPSKGGAIVFDLSFMLLSAEINLVAEDQSHKKHMLRARDTGHIRIILVLPTEIVTLQVRTFMVQVGVLCLENVIPGGAIRLAILLALSKQF